MVSICPGQEANHTSAVLINGEIPGFVANRLMGAIREEALRLYTDGIDSVPDIETAANTALGHPMGPIELTDLVGLDVSHLIRQICPIQRCRKLSNRATTAGKPERLVPL